MFYCFVVGNNSVDSDTWLQYDFGTRRLITAVSTQGRPRPSEPQYVTTYILKGWTGSEWMNVADDTGTTIVSQIINFCL